MNAQELQKARASLLVLIRNNVKNIAVRLSKDAKLLEDFIRDYERNGGNKHDLAKAIGIGLSRVNTAGADGTAIFSGEGLSASDVNNLINSTANLVGSVSCAFDRKRCPGAGGGGGGSAPPPPPPPSQSPVIITPPSAPPPQRGGSNLPLILGISLGAIALIIVAIILMSRKKAAV